MFPIADRMALPHISEDRARHLTVRLQHPLVRRLLLRVLAPLLLVPGLGLGQVSPIKAELPPVSFLHTSLLERCDVIVVGKVESQDLKPTGRINLKSIRVDRMLKGKDRQQIFVGGVAESLDGYPELSKLIFLSATDQGSVFAYVDHVDLTEADEKAAPDLVEAYLTAGVDEHPVRRAERLRAISMGSLKTESRFCLRVAAHELASLQKHCSYVFKKGDAELIEVARERMPPGEKTLLNSVLAKVRRKSGPDFAGTELSMPEGEIRQAYLKAIQVFERTRNEGARARIVEKIVAGAGTHARRFCEACLGDSSSKVRIVSARLLGEMSHPDSVKPILDSLPAAEGAERTQMIEALGKVGSQVAVETLRLEYQNGVHDAAVDLALARIMGPVADTILTQIERQLRRSGKQPDRLRKILHYRSPDFTKEETDRRRVEFERHRR